MADSSAGDLVTVLADSSTLVAIAVVAILVMLGAIASRYWPQRFGRWRISVAGVLLGVLALTQLPAGSLDELGQVELADAVRNVFTWPFDGIDVASTFGTSGWWLNILLFVPLGFCVRGLLQERRMWWSAAVVAGAAFLVESGQAVTGFRSSDPADFLANFVGGMLGSLLLSAVLVAVTHLNSRAGRVPRRWTIATAVVGAISSLGLAALLTVGSADRAQRLLLNELETRYGSTSLETMSDVFFHIGDDDAAFDEFLSANSVRPDTVVHRTDPTAVQVRYSDQYFGLHRCVFVTWHDDGVTFRRESGDRCKEFLGS